jgi:hypothetical protein
MTMNQEHLSKYIGSLDMMIAAVSYDLARQSRKDTKREIEAQLIKQMEEALSALHQRRNQVQFLLNAIERKRQTHSTGTRIRS